MDRFWFVVYDRVNTSHVFAAEGASSSNLSGYEKVSRCDDSELRIAAVAA